MDSATRQDETGFGNIKIRQIAGEFSYGVDAVLLADFASKFINAGRAQHGSAVDLGCGTGIIPLILSHKTKLEHIIGLEVQSLLQETAVTNIVENQLCDRIEAKLANVAEIYGNSGESLSYIYGRADYVTANPPYFKAGNNIENAKRSIAIARQEVLAGLSDFCRSSSILLKNRGELFMIHRADRLADVFQEMRRFFIEPRDVRIVSSKPMGMPQFVLIRGIKGGGKNLRWMPPIAIYGETGEYSHELIEIYERK